ncbi:methyltransferase [Bacillus xiamenensis]|uniref:Methyltransferase n=1 Tax=Bacillus xiamenensis TaxID=1178537 RepID=A0AAC9IFR6_9BACI|nr:MULTISPECIES: class I SAM-dependent methyltransferase [Bacillus]AOZ88366.1 methyltransferase [Bacillus xiamenensis]EKF33995.1 methyltransferase, UbiE/COQ5 family protein [Bacillus xiamenensis]QGX67169.1 methyltransferase domain-containing protein [Bacillus sp. ms-22]
MNPYSKAETQFSQNAENYRDSPIFAAGEELEWMKVIANTKGHEHLLDIGSGAGHTVFSFSDIISKGIGIDVTHKMIEVAEALAKERHLDHITFQQAGAEALPFSEASFDLVTCRFAAHHFPNLRASMSEISRVLKKGGKFLLVDHYAPENRAQDEFINHLNRLRDPSHVRESSLSEWKELFADNHLTKEDIHYWDLQIDYQDWIKRGRTPESVQKEIVSHLQAADPETKQLFQLQFDEYHQPTSLCLKAALLQGIKQ